jgi:transposase
VDSGAGLICDSWVSGDELWVSGDELEAAMGWRRGQAYGPELRGRVLAACDGGASVREVAERLMVSPSYVVKVRQRRADTGETVARRGTGRPPSKMAAYRELLRERVAALPDATLSELRGWLLAERGVAVSPVTIWRALAGLRLTLKKSRSAPPSRTART